VYRLRVGEVQLRVLPLCLCGRGVLALGFLSLAMALAAGQSVSVSPTSLSFSNQVVNTASSVQKVTLKNGQTVALAISNIATTLSDFSQTNNCPISPSTLAAGKSCTISVVFKPAALGARKGSLNVTDNATNSPQSVALSGTGIAAVTVTPTSISFANQVIGTKSAASSITVKNNQTVSLTINSISSNLGDYTATSTCPSKPKTLAAGGTCTISVVFAPTVAGVRSGTLTVSDNASNSPTVTLTGTGVLAASTNVGSLTFGSQALGTSSPPQTVVLTNNQTSSLTITSVGSNLVDFGVISTCPISPATLAAGGSCNAVVTFSPKATGARSGTLSFTDSANNSPQTVPLSGTGTPANLVSIALSPLSPSIALGRTQQFTATGTYSDGTTQNLTSSVTWSSSAPAAASVTSGGLATSLKQGATTITAASGSISGSTTLTVTSPVLMSITVSPATAAIALGTTQQYKATGTYSDSSTQDLTATATWGSTIPTVAGVSSGGLASGAGQGSTTITAAVGTIAGTSTLTVGPPALVSLAITPANASFALGTALPLKATGTYTDGSTLDVTSSVTWSTANSAIATVNSQGLATSAAVGSTSVNATLGSISGTTTLTVSPATLVSIAVTPAIPVIPLGTTKQFSATGTFTDGSTQDITGTVQWSSDNPAVATISNSNGSQGMAASVATGAANITATQSTIQGSTTLTVSAAALVSIAVTPGSATIALGTQQAFTATGSFTDGTTQDLTSTATWSSDTTSAATINSAGLASSVGLGTANITATLSGIRGSGQLTVTAAALVSIAIAPPEVTTPLGTTQAFTALGTYTDGTTQDVTQAGHWSSSTAGVATVSNTPGTQGLASTLGTGVSTIGIGVGGVSGTATLTVSPAALLTITLSPQTPNIPLGTAQQFTATGTYTDGSSQDVSGTVQWASSSATVAIISTSGVATSAGTGTTTISATQGTVTAATTLTVGAPAIVSLTVSPGAVTIPLGTMQQFQAIATYTDGSTQDLTTSATWSSDTQSVALINSSGSASGIGIGAATISATSGGASSGAVLMVTAAVPESLAVSPQSSSIAFGAQQQFQAFLTYSDGTVQNVTSVVNWTSTVPAVATVNNLGLAVAVTAGNTNIFAASNGMMVGGSLTVAAPSLISIAITPANPTIALSNSQQFTATGTYADRSKQDLTSVAIWNSSKSNVLTLSSSGLGTAMGFGASTITATQGTVNGSNSVTVPTAPTVSPALFDMTINKTTTPWPTDTFTGQRLLGTGTLWGNLETADGVYNWTTLDKFTANVQSHGVDLLYTFLGVPQWASSNPNDTTCNSWSGSCDPPNDLNSDGTGSNAHFDTFVTKLAAHVGTSIKYWEVWNEPNVVGYANKNWTSAQWVRMTKDARQIILSANPNAVIVSPGIATGTSWLTNFLAAGGGAYVDVIGFHGYANPPESVLSLITPVQTAMAAGGMGSLPLWDTEASWGADTVLPDLDMQAGSVARLYLLNAANGVSRLYWYGWDFSARGTLWQPNTATGCTAPNNGGYICPAGIAYAQLENWIVGAVLSGCSSSGSIWTCTLARPGGYFAQVMWDSSRTCSGGVCQTTPYTPPPQFIKYRDLSGVTYGLTGATFVPLGAKPVILENQ